MKEEAAGDEEANEGKSEGAEGGDGAEKGEGNESDEAKKALQKKTKEAKPVCGIEDGCMHTRKNKIKIISFFGVYVYLPYIVFTYALQKIVCDVYFHFFIINKY